MRFRLPWVARFAYDDLLEQVKFLRAQNGQLVETIVQMKVSGGVLVRPPEARIVAGTTPVPKSAIEQAIDENKHASRNPRLRAHLAAWAAGEIEKGVPVKEVIRRLQVWALVPEHDDGDEDDDDVIDLGGADA